MDDSEMQERKSKTIKDQTASGVSRDKKHIRGPFESSTKPYQETQKVAAVFCLDWYIYMNWVA